MQVQAADINRSSSAVTAEGHAGELKEQLHDVSTNNLGDLLPFLVGLGSLTPNQRQDISQLFNAEITRRIKSADLPTDLQSCIKLLTTSSSLGTSDELWEDLLRTFDTHFNAAYCKGVITCLRAGAHVFSPPSAATIAALVGRIFEQEANLKELDLRDWLSLAEALAKLRFNPGTDVLHQICDAVKSAVLAGSKDGMAPWEGSHNNGVLIWATVMLTPSANLSELMLPLLHSLRDSKKNWNIQDASKLIAGLAMATCLTEQLVRALQFENLGADNLDEDTMECLAAAYLCLPAVSRFLPNDALEQALRFRKQRLTLPRDNAQAVGEVADVLSSLGIPHETNLELAQGLLVIDVAITSHKLALMLSPDTQFCSNVSTQPLGSTMLEWRLLAMQGWQVIVVPVSLWGSQPNQEQRTALLRESIQGPTAIEAYLSLSSSIPRNLLTPKGAAALPSPGIPAHPISQGPSETSLSDPRLGPARTNEDTNSATSISPKSVISSAQPTTSASETIAPPLPESSADNVPSIRGQSISSSGSVHGPAKALQSRPSSQAPHLEGLDPSAALNTGEQITLAQDLSSRLTALQVTNPFAALAAPAMPYNSAPLSGLMSPAVLPSMASNSSVSSVQGRLSTDVSSLSTLPSLQGMLPQAYMPQPRYQLGSAMSVPSLASAMSGKVPPPGGLAPRSSMPGQQGDLRSLWQQVTQQAVDHGQPIKDTAKRGVSVAELKRVIDALPLEANAVSAVAGRLAQLTPEQFAYLLTELARDNHAFRAWQLFDWVRGLPEDNSLRDLCDGNTYTTMISLCGPWQQVRRALSLVADMKTRSMQCGIQAYSALLNAAVKCGEIDLAVEVYKQMDQEGMKRDRHIFQTMVDVFVKMARHSDALEVLEDMKKTGLQAEVQLYNLIVLSCTKLNNPRAALDVYKRMADNGVQPNTKTFTALIGSVGRMNTMEQAMEIIEQLLSHDKDRDSQTQTYSALMSACEKAGQWDLAVALFDKMSADGCKPDVSIFNSMIAACAHGGEYVKARAMFDRMAEHDCVPEAVTYANLIRACKKGGQWCHALDTFEAMQRCGCKPHAAVFSSIIDVLWQTGIAWAQAKALDLFTSAVQNGSLAGAAESCKKGTLKVDLQALTVGVAVLSMAAWLDSAKKTLQEEQPGSAGSLMARKLAIVNGLGEHSRAQGHSAAVKEAVGAGLMGCKAPFRLVQDHSRSGRLEASSLALRKWLFSDAFEAYFKLIHGGPEKGTREMLSTGQYLKKEHAESEHCIQLFQRIKLYEQNHPVTFKVLHNQAGNYLALRKQLVGLTLHFALRLHLSQETAHTALALMDRCALAGLQAPDNLQPALVCTCLRVAAIQENAYLPTPAQVEALTQIPARQLQVMESQFLAVLQNDTECISAVHCLKTYLQRLGVDLSDGEAVKLAAGCAFALATHALAELPIMQFPPSLTAAAVLVAARKAQGSVPFWPSVLAQMTGYMEASTPSFASAISHAEQLCSKLCSSEETHAAAQELAWGAGGYQ